MAHQLFAFNGATMNNNDQNYIFSTEGNFTFGGTENTNFVQIPISSLSYTPRCTENPILQEAGRTNNKLNKQTINTTMIAKIAEWCKDYTAK